MIVKELSHEPSDPIIDSQILEASGADVLLQFTYSKFAVQGIRAAAGLDWHPMHIVCSDAGSIGATFIPAGVEAAKGVVTASWERNPADPAQADHAAVKEFKAFATKYMPGLDFNNTAALPGYNNAYMIRAGLERCGDELTREHLLRQATTVKDITPSMFIDGIGVYNSPTDYRAIHRLQLTRFDGTTLAPLGAPVLLDNAS